jgi:hypothetical protein
MPDFSNVTCPITPPPISPSIIPTIPLSITPAIPPSITPTIPHSITSTIPHSITPPSITPPTLSPSIALLPIIPPINRPSTRGLYRIDIPRAPSFSKITPGKIVLNEIRSHIPNWSQLLDLAYAQFNLGFPRWPLCGFEERLLIAHQEIYSLGVSERSNAGHGWQPELGKDNHLLNVILFTFYSHISPINGGLSRIWYAGAASSIISCRGMYENS